MSSSTIQVERQPQPFLTQVLDLLRIELTNWRWSWRVMVVLGMGGPLSVIIGLRLLLANAGPAVLARVFAGNVALALIFDNQMRVSEHFQFMRVHGTLDYFAALPLRKSALLIGVAGAFFILSLPSLLVLTVIGPIVLGLSLHPSVAILIVAPLCALPLSGIGALVGLLARTPAEASSISMVVTLLLAPVAILPTALMPAWALPLARFSPAVYAASALRQTLIGPVTGRLWLDLSILGGFGACAFWAATHKLDWRQR